MKADSKKEIDSLKKILQNFSGKRILVIGDLMWDEYIRGECTRVSPEAPVQVVLSKHEERMPGGATNVLKNLTDLRISAGIMGVVGADNNGHDMIKTLKGWNLNMVQIWESPDRPTTIKTRILARNQQLLRLDREYAKAIPLSIEKKILQVLEQCILDYAAIILSDYDKGVFTEGVIKGIISIARKNNVFVAVDPQIRHFRHYINADIMTPNEKEASEGVGLPFPENEADVETIGKAIKEKLGLRHLLITRSEKGMALFEGQEKPFYVPTFAREVYDVTGAGDTVIAVFTAAIVAGATPLQAALLSNLAGGIVVGKLGTATVTRKELRESLKPESIKYKKAGGKKA